MTLDSFRQEQNPYFFTEDKFNSTEEAQHWVERHWNKFFHNF